MAIDGIVLAYRGGSGRSQVATASTLSKGCVVFCRSHHHLVEDVQPPEDGGDTAKLILLARLSLYGHGAARLHDEVLELVAEWDPADPTRRLRVLNATKTDMALADLETSLRERLPAVDEAIQHQLRAGLPADVAQLKARLEANAFVKVLQEQRERILKTRTRHDSEFEQLAFGLADHELRQLRDNRSYWDNRLAMLELGAPSFPVDLLLCKPEAAAQRYGWGDPYPWPDSVRDTVLARLLALNAELYTEEVALGLHSKGAKASACSAPPPATRPPRTAMWMCGWNSIPSPPSPRCT